MKPADMMRVVNFSSFQSRSAQNWNLMLEFWPVQG